MQLTNTITSIAIGSFDGIHQAHQALISQAEAVVIIEQNRCTLTPGYTRTEPIQKPCFFYHFDKIKSLSADAFIAQITQDFPKLETIIVGYDFGFGYKKQGNTTLLHKLFEGKVIVVEEVKHNAISVHSRTIKEHIQNGDIQHANALLNRAYRIRGEVISGQGLGNKELVPTLNLRVYDYLLPHEGVYATQTRIGEAWLPSVSFLGHRITTDGSYAVETHILDQEIGKVTGAVSIKFCAFVRGNQKFDGLASLKTAIFNDIKEAKRLHQVLGSKEN